ncbi:HNH endonuclease signature motif containing protein, partial [Mycolicibacterium sp. F2034L]|uniref:HNH endonuclease signature motif containing protein n=1 Tax=Mycolicibacterium sp. F2034L TaxID=2926422 RepID=UPI001FF6263A
EELQQRKRYLRKGKQQRDGMTPIHGLLDPETAALIDVAFATHGRPSTDANGLADTRTKGQRHHDALKTVLHDSVESGNREIINGLPATIVATTTLGELESAAGYAATAGGTRLPIRDLIRMAGQARHYLAVFDDHHREVLYLGRAKRCATTAQRLALFARDIGCTRPGCTKPAYDCQAHHGDTPWAAGGNTNIDELALACTPDHATLEDTGWTTRRRNGHTEWVPPPKLDTGQTRINHYHHPQRYLHTEDSDGSDGDDDD